MMEANVILSAAICILAWVVAVAAVYTYFSISARVPRPDALTNSYLASAWYLDWKFYTPLNWWLVASCIWAFVDKQWFLAILCAFSTIFTGTIAASLLPSNRRRIEDRPHIGPQFPLDEQTSHENTVLGNSINSTILFLAAVTTLACLHVGWKWYAAVIACASTYGGAFVWVFAIVGWIGWKHRTHRGEEPDSTTAQKQLPVKTLNQLANEYAEFRARRRSEYE